MIKIIITAFAALALVINTCVIYYWRDTAFDPANSDLISYLVILPMLITALVLSPYFIFKAIQRYKEKKEEKKKVPEKPKEKKIEKEIENLCKDKKVLGIGEIGLDYYWMNDPKDIQQNIFRKQMELAKRVNKPVVIHTRDAMEDTINILNEYKDVEGILHCYPGSFETAKLVMDRYYFGVAGVVTFKNNVKTKEFVEKMPLDRLLIETDSPYLTPVPYRGKRNEPSYVEFVAQEVANIKGITVEEVIRVTTENAKKIYGIGE